MEIFRIIRLKTNFRKIVYHVNCPEKIDYVLTKQISDCIIKTLNT